MNKLELKNNLRQEIDPVIRPKMKKHKEEPLRKDTLNAKKLVERAVKRKTEMEIKHLKF
jgi:hypothetical protein